MATRITQLYKYLYTTLGLLQIASQCYHVNSFNLYRFQFTAGSAEDNDGQSELSYSIVQDCLLRNCGRLEELLHQITCMHQCQSVVGKLDNNAVQRPSFLEAESHIEPLLSCILSKCSPSNNDRFEVYCIYDQCNDDPDGKDREGLPTRGHSQGGLSRAISNKIIHDIVRSAMLRQSLDITRVKAGRNGDDVGVQGVKRGYTDMADVCVEFHCADKKPGSFSFLKCISDNRCAG